MEIERHGLTELYAPKQLNDTVAHVIFIHGLFGHPYKTWAQAPSHSAPARPFAIRSSSSLSNPDNAAQNTADLPSPQDDNLSLKNKELSIDKLDESPRSQGERSGSSVPEALFWPKTLLPSVIPNARIFTWGYDADVSGWLSSASQNSIHQHAGNLLGDLSDLRTGANDHSVPLIFVVHSLGGIVVKDALNQSAANEGTRWKCIVPATFGIIFLGTPHRGSKSASLGKIALQITQVATRRPNLRLLKGLERNSETLDRIGDSFIQTMERHKIRLCTFREERETRKYLLISTMVVDAGSAKLGVASEEVNSIPSDHSNMTKFKSRDDVGFKRVSSHLRRWIEEIENQGGMTLETQTDCLRSLDISETRLRINEVHKAHEKTFHWLFDPQVVPFHQWLRGDQGARSSIFWIQGKPGSGKSTLMKFAMQDPRTLQLLQNATTSPWTLVAFFFHDRGSEIQRSLNGMLQEILHSIFQQHPTLLRDITPLYLELVKSQRAKVPAWDILTLKRALLTVARARNPGVRLCLFLDALDEHGGNNEQLATLLKEMVKSTDGGSVQIKVCVASRPWSVFTQHFGNCPGFAIHEHTRDDIRSYTTSRLTPDHLGLQHLLTPHQFATIIARVTDKSSGVFIWVRIVVDQLCKDIQDGTPLRDLEQLVMDMPPELEDLYAHTLRRIEGVYCDESYIMLQMALCSLSPLSLEAFMECTSYNQKYLDGRAGEDLRTPVTRGTTLEVQLRRLASRTGGLLEAIASSPAESEFDRTEEIPWQDVGYYVQFIHQTAKEYVGKYGYGHGHGLGLARLSNHVRERNGDYFLLSPNAHYQDANFGYFDMSWAYRLRRDLFTYAKRLESSMGSSDPHFYCRILRQTARACKLSDLKLWLAEAPLRFFKYFMDKSEADSDIAIDLEGVIDLEGERVYISNLPYVFQLMAVAANLIVYIREELARKPFTREKLDGMDLVKLLLHVAVAGPDLVQWENADHCAVIETLVGIGCPVDEQLGVLPYGRETELLHPSDLTPLAYLLICQHLNSRSEERRLQIARMLLKLGANANAEFTVEVRLNHNIQLTLLEYCVRYNTAPFVRLLLQHGASQPHCSSIYSLGELAFLRGDKTVIQALQDHGVSFHPASPGGSSPETIQGALTAVASRLSLWVPHGQAMG